MGDNKEVHGGWDARLCLFGVAPAALVVMQKALGLGCNVLKLCNEACQLLQRERDECKERAKIWSLIETTNVLLENRLRGISAHRFWQREFERMAAHLLERVILNKKKERQPKKPVSTNSDR